MERPRTNVVLMMDRSYYDTAVYPQLDCSYIIILGSSGRQLFNRGTGTGAADDNDIVAGREGGSRVGDQLTGPQAGQLYLCQQ
ncbi:hypothetical protein J6590_055542 [Homalodisca vitripennis]|nr:hypothetical protein J6590_055542 [Homalodisca vitripennis]